MADSKAVKEVPGAFTGGLHETWDAEFKETDDEAHQVPPRRIVGSRDSESTVRQGYN